MTKQEVLWLQQYGDTWQIDDTYRTNNFGMLVTNVTGADCFLHSIPLCHMIHENDKIPNDYEWMLYCMKMVMGAFRKRAFGHGALWWCH